MATRASAPTRRRAGGTDDGDVDPALPQKKRARHRLIGAIALCGVAAVVVPLLLDPEPTRPATDVSIVIPSKDTPLPARAADPKGTVARGGVESAPEASRAGTEAGAKGAEPKAVDAKGAADPKGADTKTADAKGSDTKGADVKGADAKGGAVEAAAAVAAASGAGTKPADSKSADARAADPKPAAAKAEPSRANASGKDEIAQLAESAQARAAVPKAGDPRYLLQIGAYAGESGANAAVERVGALGLRAFTEKVKTDAGDRIRVRVGPFPTREAAEQARAKLQASGVQAALIAPASTPSR